MPIRRAIILSVLSAGTTLAEPTSDTLTFRPFATIENMGRIDVNPITGEIAVGSTGPGSGSAQQVRVIGTDGVVRSIGQAVPDPDSVAWDIDGTFSQPGSILVGGVGGVFSVAADGTTDLRFETGLDLVNPEDMAFAVTGELYLADFNESRVQVIDPSGIISTASTSSLEVNQVAVSLTGDVAFGDQSGRAFVLGQPQRSIDAGERSFLTGLAFGDGSARWGDDIYGINGLTGDLLRFDDEGVQIIASEIFGPADPTQLHGAEIDFLPTGEMVVAVPVTDTVWTVVPAPTTGTLLAIGGLTAMRRRR